MIKGKTNLVSLNGNTNQDYLLINNTNSKLITSENEGEKTVYSSKKFLPPIKLNKKTIQENKIAIIKENVISKWQKRNLELVKRMSEKVEKEKQRRYFELHKHKKNSMERLDLIKQSFSLECVMQNQKREEIKNKNDEKLKNNTNIYTYYIFHSGNSSESIEQCLQKRKQWKLYDKDISYSDHFEYPNLLWSHYSKKINFSQFSRHRPANMKEMTNHFEKHRELSNKLLLFENLMSYCENKNKDILSFVPVTFPLQYEGDKYIRDWNCFVNVFNNIEKYINIKTTYQKYRDIFIIEPKGKIGHRTNFYIPNTHYAGRNLWLVKAIDLNRGRCIKISDNLLGIESIIKHFYKGLKKEFFKNVTQEQIDDKEENDKYNNNSLHKNNILPSLSKIKNSNEENKNNTNKKDLNKKVLPETYQNSIVIIQKYIEKPLCYKGRKCDMRIWVLLTFNFEVYIFKEGHFKATSAEYDVNSKNSYVHLTNYSVQKHNKNFAKFEIGNEISFSDFEKSFNNKISVKYHLLPDVKDIIILTMKSVKNKINPKERKMCFEIFGYDFMFDENYKPYLLEINTNPGLEISSPLIQQLIPRMIDDAFKLTLDEVFILNEESRKEMQKNPFPVDGYDNNENLWELLCNLN